MREDWMGQPAKVHVDHTLKCRYSFECPTCELRWKADDNPSACWNCGRKYRDIASEAMKR